MRCCLTVASTRRYYKTPRSLRLRPLSLAATSIERTLAQRYKHSSLLNDCSIRISHLHISFYDCCNQGNREAKAFDCLVVLPVGRSCPLPVSTCLGPNALCRFTGALHQPSAHLHAAFPLQGSAVAVWSQELPLLSFIRKHGCARLPKCGGWGFPHHRVAPLEQGASS